MISGKKKRFESQNILLTNKKRVIYFEYQNI